MSNDLEPSRSAVTEYSVIVEQNQVETDSLSCLADAVRSALAWQPSSCKNGRKLATLRYLWQLYCSSLERVFDLNEHDGYMDVVLDSQPRLSAKIDKLKRVNQSLRSAAREILPLLERPSATATTTLDELCGQIAVVLRRVDQHQILESDLLSEASLVDIGGEGG